MRSLLPVCLSLLVSMASIAAAAEFAPNVLYVVQGDAVYAYAPDGTLLSNDSFTDARMVAFGPDGHLFVSTPTAVLEVDADGNTVRTFTDASASSLYGMAFGPDGRLYVNNADRILVFDRDGNLDAQMGPSPELGGGLVGMTISPNGHLWLVSATDDEIIELNLRSQVLKRFGSGYLSQPSYVAFGPGGLLFATSEATSRIHVIDPGTGIQLDQATVNNARGIAYAGDGRFHVTDAAGRVETVAFDLATGFTGVATLPLAGTGVADGLALSPYRFKVQVKGKAVLSGFAPQSYKETGSLTYAPGSMFAVLDFGPTSFLGKSLSFRADEIIPDGNTRLFHGLDMGASPEVTGFTSLWLRVKGKFKNGWYVPSKLSGHLRVTEPNFHGAFDLKLKSLKRLN